MIIRPRTYEFCIALSDTTYDLKDSLSLSASSSPYPKPKKVCLPVELNALVSAKYYNPVVWRRPNPSFQVYVAEAGRNVYYP